MKAYSRIDILLESKADSILRDLRKDIGLPIEKQDWHEGQVLFFHREPWIYFKAKKVRDPAWVDPHCRLQAYDLGRDIWEAVAASLPPDLMGKGFGLRFYMLMAEWVAERGGVLAPSICNDGSTSAEAMRVWKALRRRGYDVVYPSGI